MGDYKFFKKTYMALIMTFLMVISIIGCSVSEVASMKATEDKDDLAIHYIDVGQGDATLIKCKDEVMVIDGGDASSSSKFVSYLKKQGVDKIDYMVATHPHADHISGLVGALNTFEVSNILRGSDKSNSKVYQSMDKLIKEKNVKDIVPAVGDSFYLGDAKCTVVGPTAYNFDTNNNSISIRIEHGMNSFLFTGDAEKISESAMMYTGEELRSDVFQAGHHGSRTSNSEEFLKEVNPKYVLISCGENNKYGHPNYETMETLKKMNVKLYRTDEQGNIVAKSDGHNIEFNVNSSKNFKPGVQVIEEKNSKPITKEDRDKAIKELEKNESKNNEVKENYILNTNSKTFHKNDCSVAKKISEDNRQEVNKTKGELLKEGYKSCGVCKP